MQRSGDVAAGSYFFDSTTGKMMFRTPGGQVLPALASSGATAGEVTPYTGVTDKNYRVVGGTQRDRYAPGEMGGMRQPVGAPQRAYQVPTEKTTDVMRYRGPMRATAAAEMMIKLYNNGYLSKIPGVWGAEAEEAFTKAQYDANQNAMTLDEMFNMRTATLKAMGLQVGPGGILGAPAEEDLTPKVSTSTSISLTSRASAQALMMSALSNELGRGPTEKEVSRFLRALNTQETAMPSTTTSTYYPETGKTVSTSKASPVEAGAEAAEYARGVNPAERRMYKGAQYFDVISEMVGG